MRRSSPCLLALSLLLAGACSDDAKPASDAAPDRGVVDLARDRSALEASATDARRDRPAVDAASISDTRPATDRRPAEAKPPLDLAQADLGKSKLLIWTTCSTNPTCKPYCGAIGSKSEGWFDPCTTQLMKNPTTGQPYWDQCATCVVACEAIGTFSEGWYAHCP